MSESPEPTTEAVTTPVETRVPDERVERPIVVESKPNRLFQVAAWVAIVAGSLFIVAVVFFSGFILGRQSGGGHFDRHGEHGMMMDRQGGPPWEKMQHRHGDFGWPGGPGGPGGPGMMWPGGPQPGPGNNGPGQPPQTPPTR